MHSKLIIPCTLSIHRNKQIGSNNAAAVAARFKRNSVYGFSHICVAKFANWQHSISMPTEMQITKLSRHRIIESMVN